MLFSSITFLYYFLPIVLLLYYAVPRRFKNFILLLASFVFYAWGEPKYVFLMLLSVAIGYSAGYLMDRLPKKPVMIVSIGLCLAFLLYFKYTNFFIINANALLQTQFPLLKVVMPIGISFYTFQIISYIVDVYRGDVEKQKNYLNLATYISMFPQLIAGPIVRYSDINKELEERAITGEQIAEGIRRFIIGLGKKVLLANQLGELCGVFRDSGEQTLAFYWVYAVATMLHIYFDFSGYSDMAIGLGKLLGFSFLENFNYPFMSKSVTEFWRRWHMSLGSWFRDYVYIPLGGNRRGKGRQLLNIFVVWMLTGFWHGAEWNFILWGLLFAVLLVVEKLWLLERLNKSVILSRLYLLLVVCISFVIFSAPGVKGLGADLRGLFTVNATGIVGAECLYYLKSYGPILLLSILGATNWPKRLYGRLRENAVIDHMSVVVEPILLLAVLLLSTAYLVDGSFNPFLYFRF